MQNKGIYTDISRNAIAIRAESALNNPERRSRSSGNNQPQRIPRGLYHAITTEPIGAAMHHISQNRYRPRRDMLEKIGAAAQSPAQSIQRRPIPTGTGTDRQTAPTKSARTDRTKPEQLVTVSPRRIFRSSPVGGVDSRFTSPLFVMPEKGFLRLSANFSAELHLITVIRH